MNWVKVNSTKKTIRYHPPEIVVGLDELALATEHLAIVSRASWDSFLKSFSRYYTDFQAAVQALAALDCLHSLATLSRNKVEGTNFKIFACSHCFAVLNFVFKFFLSRSMSVPCLWMTVNQLR